jgi:hemolysin III
MDFHDPVAAWLHLGFALWCLLAGAFLVRWTRRHPTGHRIAIVVYATSAVVLYTCSGLFHSLRYHSEQDPQFEFFRRLDLSAIFGLIAGSCVPTFVYVLPKRWMRVSLITELAVAITGIVLVWSMEEVVTQTLIFVYVGMGLIAIVPVHQYYRHLGWRGMALIFSFASFYVAGAVAQALKWPVLIPGLIGYHEVLHVCDIIATLLHFILLVSFALPLARRRIPEGVAAAAHRG